MLQHVYKHDVDKANTDQEDELQNDSEITAEDVVAMPEETFTCPK